MSENAPEGGQQDDGGQQGQGGSGAGDGDRMLTQADVDRIVADRLARERQKYADYGDLKKKAAEFDKLAEQQKTEAEKAVEAARLEGRSEALSAANDRLLRAEVKAAAAGKLSDPADAVRMLDLSSFKVGDDGEIDSGAIGAAIEDLVRSKPYLAAQPQGFQGSGDNGSRGGKPGGPAQITSRAELRKMTPAEIVKARKEGRLNRLLGARE